MIWRVAKLLLLAFFPNIPTVQQTCSSTHLFSTQTQPTPRSLHSPPGTNPHTNHRHGRGRGRQGVSRQLLFCQCNLISTTASCRPPGTHLHAGHCVTRHPKSPDDMLFRFASEPSSSLPQVPITVITGFLGAGKVCICCPQLVCAAVV